MATTRPADAQLAAGIARATQPVRRFDVLERIVHWVNAVLFLTLLVSGSCLFIPALAAAVGRRETFKDLHVIAGFALPVPIIVGAVLAWLSRRSRLAVGAGFAADGRDLARFTAADRRWLRRLGRDRSIPFGKFNAGQKLNAAFVVGAIPVTMVTGLMLRFPEPFADSWRTGATFVHDWMYLALAVVIIGHVAKALSDPTSLKSMVTGHVPRWWAAKHRTWRFDVAPTAEPVAVDVAPTAEPATVDDAGPRTVS